MRTRIRDWEEGDHGGRKMKPMIIAFSGRPGSGKSTLSRIISKKLNAVYLRIDTIEGFMTGTCKIDVGMKDYELSQVIAFDNLELGNIVVSDGCNYSKNTRNGWEKIADEAKCKCINIEVKCSDNDERRRRLSERHYDLSPETIDDIMKEHFEEWDKEHTIIDTISSSTDRCVDDIMTIINKEKDGQRH